MGKNKSKRRPRTELAKWTSIMRKIDNQLNAEKQIAKKAARKTENK